jgi:hypothetical protein
MYWERGRTEQGERNSLRTLIIYLRLGARLVCVIGAARENGPLPNFPPALSAGGTVSARMKYLIKRFADQSNKKAGEYYTPTFGGVPAGEHH